MLKLNRVERMRRHHRRHGGRGGLNLVSLMDIFTILVFFLLVNSGDVDRLPGGRDLALPESIAETPARETVIVTVTHDDILLQGRRVASVADVMASGQTLIPELVESLQRLAAQSLRPGVGDDGIQPHEVTIMGDRELPYRLLRRVMASSTEANYTHVSLAVAQRTAMASME
jgi:biopolymer transport protein TolR